MTQLEAVAPDLAYDTAALGEEAAVPIAMASHLCKSHIKLWQMRCPMLGTVFWQDRPMKVQQMCSLLYWETSS